MEPTSLLLAPSTVHRFEVTAPPLTERSEPPSRPLSLTLSDVGRADAGHEGRELQEVAAVQRQLAHLLARDQAGDVAADRLHREHGRHLDVHDLGQRARSRAGRRPRARRRRSAAMPLRAASLEARVARPPAGRCRRAGRRTCRCPTRWSSVVRGEPGLLVLDRHLGADDHASARCRSTVPRMVAVDRWARAGHAPAARSRTPDQEQPLLAHRDRLR